MCVPYQMLVLLTVPSLIVLISDSSLTKEGKISVQVWLFLPKK